MTKTERKHTAQGILMESLQVAFAERGIDEKMVAEMSRQMARIEKMFGYKPFSFGRGV